MTKRTITSLLVSIAVFVVSLSSLTSTVYAGCESTYGGGETCIYNKSFEIEKKVRIKGDKSWKDKVTGVLEDETVEFRIRIENVGEVEVDDMKYEDFLPDEMFRTGGSGLTEYWDNFAPGDVETFEIEAQIDSDEYNGENFEKCVVNKVELFYKDNFEGSDTATVCYEDGEVLSIKELPETGPASNVALALSGLSLTAVGTLVRRKLR